MTAAAPAANALTAGKLPRSAPWLILVASLGVMLGVFWLLDQAGITLPALNTIMPSGIEGALRVRGANPPKTKPTAVAPPAATSRPVWRPKRTPKTPPPETPGDDTKGTP